jgi:hypothetical protein
VFLIGNDSMLRIFPSSILEHSRIWQRFPCLSVELISPPAPTGIDWS